MRVPLLVFAALFVCVALGACAVPEIAFITEPACNGEGGVLTGGDFVPGKRGVKALCLDPYDCEVLGGGAGTKAVGTQTRTDGAYTPERSPVR